MKEEVEDIQRQFSQFNNVITEITCRLISTAYFKPENDSILSPALSPQNAAPSAEDHLKASQSALTGVRDNWVWLRDLTTCLDKQIESASNYHLFNQSLCEYKKLLKVLKMQAKTDFGQNEYTGEHQEANCIYKSIQKTLTTFLQWWERIDAVIFQSRKILPIGLRRVPVDIKRPAKMLITYKTNKISLKENEDVFVCDSLDPCRWQVENLRGTKDAVPSICVQLSGVETESIEKAVSLRLDLLTTWTMTLKEMGKDLINFMLALFQRSNKALQISVNSYQMESKLEMLELLQVFENLLHKYWSKKVEFHEMRERIYNVHVALSIHTDDDEVVDDNTQIDLNTVFLQMAPLVLSAESKQEEALPKFQVQKSSLNLLIQKYQEFSKYWEVFKIFVEAANDPNHFWMMEEFHKIKHVNIHELFSYLKKEKKEVWTKQLKLFLEQQLQQQQQQPNNSKLHFNTQQGQGQSHLNRRQADILPTTSYTNPATYRQTRLQTLNETDEEFFEQMDTQQISNEHYTTFFDMNRDQWYHTSYRLFVNEDVNSTAASSNTNTFLAAANGEISRFFHYLPNAANVEYVIEEDDALSESSNMSQNLDEMKYFTNSFTEKNESSKVSPFASNAVEENDISRILYYSPDVVYNDYVILEDGEEVPHPSNRTQSKDQLKSSSDEKRFYSNEAKNNASSLQIVPKHNVDEVVTEIFSEEDEILKMLHLLTKNADIKIATENMGNDAEVITSSHSSSDVDTETVSVSEEEQLSSLSHILKQPYTANTTDLNTTIKDVKQSTILISGICDTLNNEICSLQKAVEIGIINEDNGTYLDTLTKNLIPIPIAMNEDLIQVESTNDENNEEFHNYGIFTIKTYPFNKNHDVQTSTDTQSHQDDTLNENEPTNSDKVINEKPSLTENSNAAKESVTYLIFSVMDMKLKTALSFNEALYRGLIDVESGVFINSQNEEKVDIVDAIERGFLKSEIISDTDSLLHVNCQHFTIEHKIK